MGSTFFLKIFIKKKKPSPFCTNHFHIASLFLLNIITRAQSHERSAALCVSDKVFICIELKHIVIMQIFSPYIFFNKMQSQTAIYLFDFLWLFFFRYFVIYFPTLFSFFLYTLSFLCRRFMIYNSTHLEVVALTLIFFFLMQNICIYILINASRFNWISSICSWIPGMFLMKSPINVYTQKLLLKNLSYKAICSLFYLKVIKLKS